MKQRATNRDHAMLAE